MFRKLKISALFLATTGAILGTILNHDTSATIAGTNVLASYNSTNTGPSVNQLNQRGHISEDGNVVVWYTNGHDVIPSDPHSSSTAPVLYKRNLQSGATSYVSVDSTGVPVEVSMNPETFAISRTGRYVAYSSKNTNVVTSPTVSGSDRSHLYLTDTLLGTTTLVDQNSSGTPANLASTGRSYARSVSDDGRFVVFYSTATNLLDSGNPSVGGGYYVKDLHTGQVFNPTASETGARANSAADHMMASCDGSLLAFVSASTNLTPDDDGQSNVYLVDLRKGYKITNLTHHANQLVSLMSMSCNGRYLVVGSKATNLTSDTVTGLNRHYFRYDRLTNTYDLVDQSTSGYISSTATPTINYIEAMRAISDDGKIVFFSDDHNMVSPAATRDREVYLRDPDAGTTELVPVSSSGMEQDTIGEWDTLEISAQGNAVLYNSKATNLVPGMTTSALKLVISKIE